MARGDVATIEHAELPPGWVLTTSGRISGVTEPGELSVHYPFPIADLVALDDALTYSSRACQVRFAIYLGDLGRDTAARAARSWARCPRRTMLCCSRSRPTSAPSKWSTARKSAAAVPSRRLRSGLPPLPQRSSRVSW